MNSSNNDGAGNGGHKWYSPLRWLSVIWGSTNSTDKEVDGLDSQTAPVAEVTALGLQNEMANRVIDSLLRERASDFKWTWFKRIVFSGLSTAALLVYVYFYVTNNTDIKFLPHSDLVGVVNISGPIDTDTIASADKIIPVLTKAFESKRVKLIILSIDSPGGVPGESERINNVIDHYRETTHKPVYAVIKNLGASAAYLIAIHADKIYACNFCMVGSIGAVIHAWDLHKAIGKVDISQRIYASGGLKDMLNPYSEMTPQSVAKAKDMVNAMATTFADEVKKYRGKKMKSGVNYFTGEVWTGEDALKLGITDEMGTLEQVVREHGDLKIFDFGPEPEKRSILKGLTGSANVGDVLSEEAKSFLVEVLQMISPEGVRL